MPTSKVIQILQFSVNKQRQLLVNKEMNEIHFSWKILKLRLMSAPRLSTGSRIICSNFSRRKITWRMACHSPSGPIITVNGEKFFFFSKSQPNSRTTFEEAVVSLSQQFGLSMAENNSLKYSKGHWICSRSYSLTSGGKYSYISYF